ncbi:MAG: Gfo/Idh/MocA family oxidoreductase [Alphaproteobacteria bacterium]|nr:Gfo/Idh/MocA family oxidoreductase [Alphaproteobacteria bacterium]
MTEKPLKLGILGIEHRHIYGQLNNMQKIGSTCEKWWTEGDPVGTVKDFATEYPQLERVTNKQQILEDESIDLILIAAIPNERAQLAIEAMRHGKDVMVDKPGCTTLEQLAEIKQVVAETGRIWSVNFSERFEVEAVTKADQLIKAGKIGKVLQTIGLGPHRLNLPTRPDWFYDVEKYGGILCDIASHQIDQFLYFTGSDEAQVIASSVGNYANPNTQGLQDFGDILLRSDQGQAYIRVDWFTPDGLPTWGDGRLTILGTEGYIELRKYVDIDGRAGKNHLFLVNNQTCEHINATGTGLPYFENLVNDVRNRTATAMPQQHAFKVMELAIKAQNQAARVGL